ncbi:MAG TPA: FG-GAP-like repeat-containing protein [Candidatus Limnocylindrales bacterium]|nr:FG-GAP-like repeat-containing protein [Candidatus Limnocylindrales bacterium]
MSLRRTLAISIIAISFGFAPGARAQSVSFIAAPAFPAGTSPTAVAAGDFNGDGKPDLAVTNQHGVQILLNNGSGGFTPGNSYVVGTNPQHVAVGDFNGDGTPDLAVVNQGSGTVSVLLGSGGGNFGGGTPYPAGTNPRFVTIADVNGDGKQDLIVVDSGTAPGTSGVSILLGDGHGNFGTTTFFAAGSVSLSAAVGDFNGDGKPDLAVVNSGSDNISIMLGNGAGAFGAPANISLDLPGISVVPSSIVAADFDSDGNLDLAVATPSHRDIAVLMGKGGAIFGPVVHYALDDPNFVNNISKLAVADLNGDNKPDLILCNLSSNHVTVLVGNGDGTFPSASSYAAGAEPIGVAIADFNGDGHADIVAADNAVDGTVALLLGNGDGTLQAAPLRRSGYLPTSFAVGDLNGDGKLDLITGSVVTPAPAGTGTGVAMLGNGDGTFSVPKIWSTSPISSVALADLDHDGKLDVIETNPNPGNGNLSVLLGKGDGTFQSAVNYTVGTTPEFVAVADLNGDGWTDVVVGNRNSGNISVLLNAGNGTLNSAVNYATPATGTPESIAIGDFNGDGIPDIAVAISGINATSIAIFLGNGDGTFQSYIEIPSGFHSSGILHIVGADFDGDGKTDMAVTDGNTLTVLLSSGNSSFLPPVTYLVGPGAGVNGTLAVSDFNGDGAPDLVASSRDGLAIFINNGDGTFQAAIPISPFLGGAIAVGDFSGINKTVFGSVGDGRPDIVAADSSQDPTYTDTIAVIANLTTGPDVPVTIDTSPSGLSFSVYYQFPPGGIISEFTTCVAGPCTYNSAFGRFFQIYASPAIAGAPGIQYALDHFSDDGFSVPDVGDIIHDVNVKAVPITVTIFYKTQYQVVAENVSPPNSGVISGPVVGTYLDSGSEQTFTATPNPGYVFDHWFVTFAPSPTTLSCPIAACAWAAYGPEVITAYFVPQQVTVPNVVGDAEAAATTAITSAGLVVGNVTHSSSNTVPSGDVISQNPLAGTQAGSGSAVDLVISTGPPVVPHVVSFSVLFGAQSYNVTGSSRVHLPWQITGIRVVFSEPIAAASVSSLTGAAPTGLSGVGTNTLTWGITPISIGNVSIGLAGSGANAIKDAAGNAVNGGSGFSQPLQILWGDFNDDGNVSATDMVLVNTAHSQPYNVFADMNGDGVVDVSDVQIVRARAGTHLP